MFTRLKYVPSWIYKRVIRVPTYLFGQPKLTIPTVSIHKLICSRKQCECNVTYVQYLHEKEQLEILIEKYQHDRENQPKK